jgi:bifunctional non-homologous end joining protein LigD
MHRLLESLPTAARQQLRRQPMPRWIDPMLATLSKGFPPDQGWVFEHKFDGERCLAFCTRGSARLLSRNEKSLNNHYPELAEALAAVKEDMVVDGEVVAPAASGRTSFEMLQARMGANDPASARATGVKVFYRVFDILHFAGYDLTGLALLDRKSILRNALSFRGPVKFSDHEHGSGKALLKVACGKGWEGLIAKDASAPYIKARSRYWLKLKCVAEQELVVGGFTEPQGARYGFGALLVGYYEGGKLRYAGKVGTGYSEGTLRRLEARLRALERRTAPFADEDLPRDGVHWVQPRLVAQVGFAEWTRDGHLRQPRFLGLREDKPAREVVREDR